MVFLSKTLGSHGQGRCAGKTALRAGKAVVTRPREGPGSGDTEQIPWQQVRGSGKETVAASFGPTGVYHPLDSGKRRGQPALPRESAPAASSLALA